MYFTRDGRVIEARDIKELRFSEVQTLPDGTLVARFAVELYPHKEYVPQPDLHLTDGVTHKRLAVTPAAAKPAEPAEPEAATSEETSKEKGKK